MSKSRNIAWTKELLREIKRRFPHEPTGELAKFLGVSFEALKKKASRMGLKKSRKRMKALGRV